MRCEGLLAAADIGAPRRLSEYARRPLEAACSAEYFVALRSQRYGVAPSSRLDSTKHSAPNRSTCILRQPPSPRSAARLSSQRAPQRMQRQAICTRRQAQNLVTTGFGINATDGTGEDA